MKLRYLSGLAALLFGAVVMLQPAPAEAKTCIKGYNCLKSTGAGYVWSKQARKWVARGSVRQSGAVRVRSQQARRQSTVLPAARQQVVSLITQMAPSFGVPTWFALRIAKVESGYNPRARGLAGEYGVFQLKCATARGIGYRGNCSGLLNATTNVRFGLKHLQFAVRSSRGNLKLAASKHNGGLGRKRLVRAYVNRVF